MTKQAKNNGYRHNEEDILKICCLTKRDPVLRGTLKINSIKAKIAKFLKLVDTIEELPKPDNGDCWHCYLHSQNGLTWGDEIKDHNHLSEHLEEDYLHGSLIVNALLEAGFKKRQLPSIYLPDDARDNIKRALRRYLVKRLCNPYQDDQTEPHFTTK